MPGPSSSRRPTPASACCEPAGRPVVKARVDDGGGPRHVSRAGFEALAAWLGGAEADGLEHAELEHRLTSDGRGQLRQLLQDQPRPAGLPRARCDVVDADGDAHTRVEAGHERGLASVVGEVRVRRLAYRRPGHANLHPADAALNLPTERHSHGLRRLAAVESTRGLHSAGPG